MKNSHLSLLLLALLLASGCAPRKPANFRELVPQSAEELNKMARESDWNITVIVDTERRVFFRKEQVGTTENVGLLKERVQQAIEKNRQAARDYKDEEMLKFASTVFVQAPPNMTYGEVSKVVETLKQAGGDPIGLQMQDDLR